MSATPAPTAPTLFDQATTVAEVVGFYDRACTVGLSHWLQPVVRVTDPNGNVGIYRLEGRPGFGRAWGMESVTPTEALKRPVLSYFDSLGLLHHARRPVIHDRHGREVTARIGLRVAVRWERAGLRAAAMCAAAHMRPRADGDMSPALALAALPPGGWVPADSWHALPRR